MQNCQEHAMRAGSCGWTAAASLHAGATTDGALGMGRKPTRNSYSSSTSRSNTRLSPAVRPGPPGPAEPVQFPPPLTPAAPTSASFAFPSALIPWAAGRGEAMSLVFKNIGTHYSSLKAHRECYITNITIFWPYTLISVLLQHCRDGPFLINPHQ